MKREFPIMPRRQTHNRNTTSRRCFDLPQACRCTRFQRHQGFDVLYTSLLVALFVLDGTQGCYEPVSKELWVVLEVCAVTKNELKDRKEQQGIRCTIYALMELISSTSKRSFRSCGDALDPTQKIAVSSLSVVGAINTPNI